jgi:CreA protein
MKNITLPVALLSGTVLIVAATLLSWTPPVGAEEIGKVDTRFRFLTPDDTVRIEVFDDPDVVGVACYLSRAKTGGVKGAIGVAEDTSDASLDCRQVGPIEFKSPLKNGEKVFSERRSLIFKELQVVRYCDTERNTLVYLAFSDRVIDGSPKNSVSAVPIAAYAGKASVVKCEDYLK